MDRPISAVAIHRIAHRHPLHTYLSGYGAHQASLET